MRRLLILLACLILIPAVASAQMAYMGIGQDEGFRPSPTCKTVAAGAFENAAIWSCGRVPNRTDWAQLDHAVTFQSNIALWTLYASPTGSLTNVGVGWTITISDIAPVDAPQFDTGIIIEGVLTLSGTPKTGWARTPGIASGATTLTVDACMGWRVGDRLLFGDSRELPDARTQVPEVRAIGALSGCTVTLSAPLSHAYTTGRDHAGVVERTIPVGNLTRDLTIKSENPMGHRGHIMLTGAAKATLNNVSVQDMGRTTLSPLDVILNHIGRYALHFHHLLNRGAVSVVGSVVERSTKWGYVIHASNGNTLRDNISYDTLGWGFGTEDSSEEDNVFEHNLAVFVRGIGGGSADGGIRGTGFWMQGPRNVLIGNVAVNALEDGFAIYETASVRHVRTINTFRDNESLGNWTGLTLWGVGADAAPSVLEHFMEWHNGDAGFYGYGQTHIEFTDFYSRSDPSTVGKRPRGTSNAFGDYDSVAVTFTRPDVQNKDVGFILPYGASSPQGPAGERVTRFADGNFYNAVDFLFQPQTMSSTFSQPMRFDVVRPLHGNATGTHYEKRFHGDGDLVKLYRLLVTDYQRGAGDSFEVFGAAQEPGFPMPMTSGGIVGCPVAGLTNQQCRAAYGVSIFGAITPASAVARARVVGKVVPAGAPPAPVDVPNVVGLTQAAATSAITAVGLAVGPVSTANHATVPAGSVISQVPVAGTSVSVGSAVGLTVSLGPVAATVTVPNVVGAAQAVAGQSLASVGLTLGAVTSANSPTVAAGLVISQAPPAGTVVPAATSVALVVSLGQAGPPSTAAVHIALATGAVYDGVANSAAPQAPQATSTAHVVLPGGAIYDGTLTLTAPPPQGSVTFVGTDAATKGTWPGKFGSQGSLVATTPSVNINVVSTGLLYTWAATTTDPRALVIPTGRRAATWYDNKFFTMTVTPPDAAPHRVSLYLLDWDMKMRLERIDVLQGGVVRDTRTVANFTQGVYYMWLVTGPVQFRVTTLEESNAAVSGVFLDPDTAAPPPTQAPTAPSNAMLSLPSPQTVGTAITVTAQHDGNNGASYLCYDGATSTAGSRTGGTVNCDFPALAAGSHQLAVAAANSVGESKSDALTMVMTDAPPTPSQADYSALPVCVTVGTDLTVAGHRYLVEPTPSFKILVDGTWNGSSRGFVLAVAPDGMIGTIGVTDRMYRRRGATDEWALISAPEFGCRLPTSPSGTAVGQSSGVLVDNVGGVWLSACAYDVRTSHCPDFDGTAILGGTIIRNGMRLGTGLTYKGQLVVMGGLSTMREPDDAPWTLCWLNGEMYAHVGRMEVDGVFVANDGAVKAHTYARWLGLARYDWTASPMPAGCQTSN